MFKELPISKFTLVILACALLVGFFHIGPQLLIKNYLAERDQPFVSIPITHRGDVNQVYMPKAREVYDGHFPPVDFHQDDAGLATIFPALPPLLFLPMFWLGGGDPSLALLWGEFIFSALIFIAFYILGMMVVKNRLWALFLGFIGTLTPMFIMPRAFQSVADFGNLVVKHFIPVINTQLDKLFLGRIDDQLLTYAVFVPAIATLFWFWQSPSKKSAITAGILNGLLAYTYFHYWVFMMVAIGLLFLWTTIKRKETVERFKNFLILLGVLVVVLVPYFIQYFNFYALPSASDYIARNAVEEGRFLRWLGFDYSFYFLLGVAIYFIFRNRDRSKTILYLGLILTMFVVWNIQLVTGFMPQPDHFWRPIGLMILIMLFDAAFQISQSWRPLITKYIPWALVLLMVLLSAKKALNVASFIEPDPKYVTAETFESYTFNKNLIDSWDWINSHLPQEPKIISDSLVTSLYLLSYTSARPYVMTGFNTVASNEEIGQRFLVANKLFGVSSDTVKERLRASPFTDPDCWHNCPKHTAYNQLKGAQHMFYNAFVKNTTAYTYIDEQFAKNLSQAYDDLRVDWDVIDADYIYVGPWEKEFGGGKFSNQKNLKLIYQNPEVEIYYHAKSF